MDWGSLVPILALVLIFGPKLFREVKDYLLKKEQIKADAELKAEALRLKNALELEKFMESGNLYNSDSNNAGKNSSKTRNNANAPIDEEDNDTLNQRRNSQYEKY